MNPLSPPCRQNRFLDDPLLLCYPYVVYEWSHEQFYGYGLIPELFLGQLWMVRAFLPRMLEMDKGSVVSLCSIAGHAGAPHMVPYSASKFAVKGMMEALHQVQSKNLNNHFNFLIRLLIRPKRSFNPCRHITK